MSTTGPATETISVLIVDDEAIFRESLTQLLAPHADVCVAGTAANGAEATEMLAREPVDVVLCDVQMPVMDGVTFAREVAIRRIPSKIVAITTFDSEPAMLAMLAAGAYGFILKSAAPRDITEAVRIAFHGGTVISPFPATRLRKYLTQFTGPAVEDLPERERSVLALLQTGRGNAAIARELGLEVTTVKKAVGRLFQRYDVSSRLELVIATKE